MNEKKAKMLRKGVKLIAAKINSETFDDTVTRWQDLYKYAKKKYRKAQRGLKQ